MGVLLGLLAAAFYGSADFCGGLATKRASTWSVTIVSQAAGFAVLLAVIWFFPSAATAQDYGWGFLGGLCGGLGIALLYYALSVGRMGIVSPITAVLAAIVPVAVGVVRGEHLRGLQVAGILAALAGIALVSMTEDRGGDGSADRGVGAAVASGLVLGGFLLFLAQSGPHAGLRPLVATRVGSIGLLAAIAVVRRESLFPGRGVLPLVVFAGLIDMSANVLYVLATFNGYLSVAAVLTSLYPASTVLLSVIFLKERFVGRQAVGIVLALAGVVGIAA
ncbi:MAG: DMT family transporter [Candidatus Eremiobacteraeota bacterium]|nr:DMT family transporter [Candidatus Eremiobacteraeota bacterium]